MRSLTNGHSGAAVARSLVSANFGSMLRFRFESVSLDTREHGVYREDAIDERKEARFR